MNQRRRLLQPTATIKSTDIRRVGHAISRRLKCHLKCHHNSRPVARARLILRANLFLPASTFRCPIKQCLGSFDFNKKLLKHIREVHQPSEVPEDFIRSNNLTQCPRCSDFFQEIKRHSTFCKGSAVVQSHTRMDASVTSGPAISNVSSNVSSTIIESTLPTSSPNDRVLPSPVEPCQKISSNVDSCHIHSLTLDSLSRQISPSIIWLPQNLQQRFHQCCQKVLEGIVLHRECLEAFLSSSETSAAT